jgi:hypothetical protein
MARTLGKAGRYATEQDEKLLLRQLFVIMLLVMAAGIAFGFSLGYFGSWWAWGFVAVEAGIFWYGKRLIDRLVASRRAWQAGADGEREVANALDSLPDTYCVIHDVSTDYGNLDHVVVGPKGVFAIETKRWRGNVASDGNGGLILNGKPTEKNPIKALTGAIMGIKDRLTPLTRIEDIYIQGLVAFPISHLDARWGTTGAAHCLSPEKLGYYIEQWYNPKRVLRPDEVERIARGFAALARMEDGFDTVE